MSKIDENITLSWMNELRRLSKKFIVPKKILKNLYLYGEEEEKRLNRLWDQEMGGKK